MCFKYEDRYPGGCWDAPFVYGRETEPAIWEWLDNFGVELVDVEQFRLDFFTFMEVMHDRGIIKPKTEAPA